MCVCACVCLCVSDIEKGECIVVMFAWLVEHCTFTLHWQNKLFDKHDSLLPGDYILHVGSEEYPFQLVGKSITQMVVASHSNGTLTFITVSCLPSLMLPPPHIYHHHHPCKYAPTHTITSTTSMPPSHTITSTSHYPVKCAFFILQLLFLGYTRRRETRWW